KTYKGISDTTRFDLAGKAFAHTARYDGLIANYLTAKSGTPEELDFPEYLSQQFIHRSELRYGENPHQKAAFYIDKNPPQGSIGATWQVQGIALSYNNINDADAALSCLKEVGPDPACVIVKHANPCGVAVESNIELAYLKAYATDPVSAFGGVLAFNHTVTEKTAELILSKQFAEVLIAPEITEKALEVFAQKKRMRILCTGELPEIQKPWQNFKRVSGGLLVQDADIGMVDIREVKVVTKRQPTEEELRDMAFAWKVAKWVKSNAIVYAKDSQTIGIGAGQMSRVVSARIAAMKAEDADLKVAGSVMASDAFFPFRDGIDTAAQAGITAIIQPGGSKKDPETIAAANEHNIAMVFTDMRHFNH
ncbi:MAG: bifunctional phosphoribosylaminoimidazolecarboxamide formyltransferase/IMP cyclohydrolase PurH, partial [Proteobacteria bacterium]